ncbi:MAG: hypothetical protein ACR2IT_02220 [Pirellulales bacterium]
MWCTSVNLEPLEGRPLRRDSSSGANVMWLMDGARNASSAPIGGDAIWRLVNAEEWSDASADHKTDCIMTANGDMNQLDIICGELQWSPVNNYVICFWGVGTVICRDDSSGSNVLRTFLEGGHPGGSALAIGSSQQWTLLARPGRWC